MEGASTTPGGKRFHVPTTLLLNIFFQVFNLDLRLIRLYWCPLVLASVLTTNSQQLIFVNNINIPYDFVCLNHVIS